MYKHTHRKLAWIVLAVLIPLGAGWATDARAQSNDPAIYIGFDTSGSMLGTPDGAPSYGDGTAKHPHYGTRVSRISMAKDAVALVVGAYPEIRWGLARFRQTAGDN